jgi:multidrug efflux pump subunit AcrA (membrane-fusion protein)
MRTEVLIANPDGVMAAGMFGRISLELERLEDVLTLAPAQLRFEKERAYVFVADDGRARRVDVVCGADDGNAIQIVSGLKGGEAVISKASASLSDGAPIRISTSSPAPEGGDR